MPRRRLCLDRRAHRFRLRRQPDRQRRQQLSRWRAGSDTLTGGPGADHLDGGTGFDWAGYAPHRRGHRKPRSSRQQYRRRSRDEYVSIEGLIGSNFDDTLIGNAGHQSALRRRRARRPDREARPRTSSMAAQTPILPATTTRPTASPQASPTPPAIPATLWATPMYRSRDWSAPSFNDNLIGDSGGNYLLGGAGQRHADRRCRRRLSQRRRRL